MTATTATLSSEFQISIPAAVREQQRWRAGQELVFILKEGNGVLLMKALKRTLATATLSGEFQIAIPDIVRGLRHWRVGQEYAFIPKGKGVLPEGKGVLMMPVPTLEQLAGISNGVNKDNYRDRENRY